MGCCICVEESQIAIIQQCGKFDRVEKAGCAMINCWCENRAGSLSLRVQQHEFDIETRTQDNVFITIKLAVRVKVAESDAEFPLPLSVKSLSKTAKKPSSVDLDDHRVAAKADLKKSGIDSKTLLYRAYYKLEDPVGQIASYIDNYFRFHAMLYTLDDMYAAKDGMTNELLNELNAKMNPYGFVLHDVLVKDILPNSKVRDAMNDVVASEKEKIATVNRAQAEKAARILSAEAESRTRELEGEGIAAARRAIVEGLRSSVDDFQEAIPATDARELLTVVLMTQYMDTLKEAAAKSKNTFVLPSSPAQVATIEHQMRQALIGNGMGSGARKVTARKKKNDEKLLEKDPKEKVDKKEKPEEKKSLLGHVDGSDSDD